MKKALNKALFVSLAKILLIETLWVLLLIGASGFVADCFGGVNASGLFMIPVCVFAIGLLLALILWKIPIPCIFIGGIWMYGLLWIVRAIPLFPIQYLDYWGLYTDTLLSNPNTVAIFFCMNGILLQVLAVLASRFLTKYFKEFVIDSDRKKDESNINKVGWKEIFLIIACEIIWLLPHSVIINFIRLYLATTGFMPQKFSTVLVYTLYIFILILITFVCFRRFRAVIFGIPMQIVGFLYLCRIGTSETIGILSFIPASEGVPKIVLFVGTVTLQFVIVGVRTLLKQIVQFCQFCQLRRKEADCTEI